MDPILQGVASNAVWAALHRIVLFPIVQLLRILKGKSPFRPAVICLKHRLYAHDEYYKKAFSSGRDVLYVSIMSHSTLKEEMRDFLQVARDHKTHLRVLTWDPDDTSIETFRQHLNEELENPQRIVNQVRQATADWQAFASTYPDVITLRRYRSSPTMQGVIVDKQWALIELIPYNTKPKERPALVLTPRVDAMMFDLFSAKFDELWQSAL